MAKEGMTRSLENLRNFFEDCQKSEEDADKRVQPFQRTFKVGDHFFFQSAGRGIYGQILDPVQDLDPSLDEGQRTEALAEMAAERKTWAQPHMKNYRFTRCFSRECPEGELGDTHIAIMMEAISKENFEKARRLRWPSDLKTVLETKENPPS